MSVQDVQRFYALMAEDEALREKVIKAGEELQSRFKTKQDFEERGLDEMYAMLQPFAREAGCTFTLNDLAKMQKGHRGKLSDEELDALSGGGGCGCFLGGTGNVDGAFWCAIAGWVGYKQIDKQAPCACVVGGGGAD